LREEKRGKRHRKKETRSVRRKDSYAWVLGCNPPALPLPSSKEGALLRLGRYRSKGDKSLGDSTPPPHNKNQKPPPKPKLIAQGEMTED